MKIKHILSVLVLVLGFSCSQNTSNSLDLLDIGEVEYHQTGNDINGFSIRVSHLEALPDRYVLIKSNAKIKCVFDNQQDTFFLNKPEVKKLPFLEERIIPQKALAFYLLHFDNLSFNKMTFLFQKPIKEDKFKLEEILILSQEDFNHRFQKYEKYTEADLPVVRLETEHSVGTQKQKSTLKITSKDDDYSGVCKLSIRGQTSKHFAKKSFALSLIEQDKNQALLGMPKEHDWVLHGPYIDISLMRNKLAYDWSRAIGLYAPRLEFCELIINKEYLGVYLLVEKIKRDKNRVNLKKRVENKPLKEYLIKIDKGDYHLFKSNYRSEIDSGWWSFYQAVYPKKKHIKPEDIALMKTDIKHFEESLLKKDDSFLQYIDIASFVDYFIINEMCKNVDAYRLSTYLYKKNNTLFMGPVWDFNYSLGLTENRNGFDEQAWIFKEDAVPFWWKILFQHPVFRSKLKKRWQSLRKGVFSDHNILQSIEDLSQQIAIAKDRNFTKWQIFDDKLGVRHQAVDSHQEEIECIKNWVVKRMHWMDKSL